MAIIESATRDALLVLRILKLIPRNHWISTRKSSRRLRNRAMRSNRAVCSAFCVTSTDVRTCTWNATPLANHTAIGVSPIRI